MMSILEVGTTLLTLLESFDVIDPGPPQEPEVTEPRPRTVDDVIGGLLPKFGRKDI